MSVVHRLGSFRLVVAVLAAVTAVHMAMIAFGNITDYGTNYEFVAHVLAMDTTFQTPQTMWRAITSPMLVTTAYIAIIIWEAIAAIVLIVATVFWLRAGLNGHGTALARRLSNVGWMMWILLFGLGFITIGGEWFLTWQSEEWNGLQPALQNFLIASVALILGRLSEGEPAPS